MTKSPCQESNLDDRLRRPVLGIHRDKERETQSRATASVPPAGFAPGVLRVKTGDPDF